MITIDVQQGSPEWFAARCGVPSASNFDKILTMDGKPSKQREKYLWQLVGERVSGRVEESFQSQAMQRGVEMEEEARKFYELTRGVDVVQVGLCLRDDKSCAASPDGLVGEEGLLEIKCPLIYTHVGYLLDGDLPSDYFQQIQGQLFVTGRKWVDFISYFPGLKPLVVRVTRDEKFLAALDSELSKLYVELDYLVDRIS